MARLYADEQFPRIATEHLRSLGHDVLTVQEAGNAGKSDPEVLEFAISTDRLILTQNRRDFVKLHRENPEHPGMVICSDNKNFVQLAERIHDALSTHDRLQNQLIRVMRPSQ
jgi:predicted nuclease of predicted toxin-antitoxin system